MTTHRLDLRRVEPGDLDELAAVFAQEEVWRFPFEVGWCFSPSVWGKGYATEGATAALDQAFTTLELVSVCSVPQGGNPPSARVAERLGMSLRREVKIRATERRGEIVGLLYEIGRDEWMHLRARGSG